MTLEEEEALFQRRVRQINRDCLATFLPYIKMVIFILLSTAGIVITGVIYYAQEMRNEVRSLSVISIENKATLTNVKVILDEHGEQILDLYKRRR